jgi:cyclase
MKSTSVILFSALLALGQASYVCAQQARRTGGGLEIIELRPNFHVIAGAGANISVQSGPDGVILVDAGSGAMSEQVLSAVRTLSSRPIRFIINTSADEDHVGGNAKIAAAGESLTPIDRSLLAAGATILAHENVLDRMSAPSGKQALFAADAWPTETYVRKQKSMFLNHEGIEIALQPAAHSDGDSTVFFRRSDVIAVGDLIDTEHFPVLDVDRGGGIQGEIDALNRLVEMAIPSTPLLGQDPGTYIVPGHGRIMEQADVVGYRDMLTIIRDVVQDLMSKGQTLEQIKQAEPTKGYTERYSASSGPGSADAFVEAVYKGLSKKSLSKKEPLER